MNNLFVLVVILAFNVLPLCAQENDYTWLFGYSTVNNPEDTTYGTSAINFYQPEGPSINFLGNSIIDFDSFNVSMSDENGNYIFSCNGHFIEDASFSIMENGDFLNPYDESDLGYRLPQGGLALPFPGHQDQYVLFHSTKATIEEPDWGAKIIKLFYSVIDMDGNNGLGAVVQKNELIINDTLSYGFMTACKHANGRDWWVVINKYPSNKFYKLLVDETGVQINDIQSIGDTLMRGLGQAVFSPDGSKYIQYMGVSTALGNYLHIYDFDRCTGEFFNPITSHFFGIDYSQGASISSNSRYLYLPADYVIYQYDLWADDIATTKDTVVVYDGFGDPFPTRFFLAQLAPDGKIYISANNSTNYLTVIHRPDNPGEACDVEQHGLRLPTRNFVSIPNNPYYRLGPLDGSPCDTLGLNNYPVAKYRYWQDTVDILNVEFTDLSYYEPATWLWDFGDGETSSELNPIHQFPEPGAYEVCLTVSNEYGTNSTCHTLYLGVTSTGGPAPIIEVSVFPNPAKDYFILNYSATKRVKASLLNAIGQPILAKELTLGNNRQEVWEVNHLPAGIYYLYGKMDGHVVFMEKILKM